MTSLAEWIESQLIGDARPPASLADMVKAVNVKYGSSRRAAAALGVPRETWRQWGNGTRVPATGRGSVVTGAWRRAAVTPPPDATVGLKVTQQDGGKVRDRTIAPGRLKLAPGTMAAAAEVYATSGKDAAARRFLAGVRDDFYRAMLARGASGRPTGGRYVYDDAGSDPGTLGGMVPT